MRRNVKSIINLLNVGLLDLKIHFGIDYNSEFMKKLEELIRKWDLSIINKEGISWDHYLALWNLAQVALKEITGLEFYFTRTDEYFGVCTEDEEFLIRIERKCEFTALHKIIIV